MEVTVEGIVRDRMVVQDTKAPDLMDFSEAGRVTLRWPRQVAQEVQG